MSKRIQVSDLGKRYRIYRSGLPPTGLLQAAGRALFSPFDYLHTRLRKPREDELLWALRGVSFSVGEGEVLGVIGKNGSGKSTLLKLLSRITDPTEGEAVLSGRVGSLLEVGTGFHPELTGRENVYLNGAILGMRKREIDAKFDDIVDFAGSTVSRLIDTPVKRYSSGMHVRLGFAVAAHLDPEVLLVDEVLSVGDAAFRRQCVAKIEEIRQHGRSILFVSHNLSSVVQLCTRVLHLERGEVVNEGDPGKVTRDYLAQADAHVPTDLAERTDRLGDQRFRFTGLRLELANGLPADAIPLGEPARLVLSYTSTPGAALDNASFLLVVREGTNDQELIRLWSPHQQVDFGTLPSEGQIVIELPRTQLAPGSYDVDLHAGLGDTPADIVYNAGRIVVEEGDFFGGGGGSADMHALFVVPHSWSVRG